MEVKEVIETTSLISMLYAISDASDWHEAELLRNACSKPSTNADACDKGVPLIEPEQSTNMYTLIFCMMYLELLPTGSGKPFLDR